MKRRLSFGDIRIPNIVYDNEFGSIIGEKMYSCPALIKPAKLVKDRMITVAGKIDDNIDFIKMLVDNYNIIGKWLLIFVGMLGFLSMLLHFLIYLI